MPLLNIPVKGNGSRRATVIFRPSGDIVTDMFGDGWRMFTDAALVDKIKAVYAKMGQGYDFLNHSMWSEIVNNMNPDSVSSKTVKSFEGVGNSVPESAIRIVTEATNPTYTVDPAELTTRWFNFFSEFQFKPQPRFMNTVARCKSVKKIREYVIGYFELTNNSFTSDVVEKIKSREFTEIASDTLTINTEKQINKRLEIYYGEAGGGKTTMAIVNNPDAKVVLCHSSMTPDELFRGFDFEEEKDAEGNITGSHPVFKGCALREAMEQGKVVILDEINLLSEDCRRALQAVTDAKSSVTINNDTITIKDGFKVIGTMNLKVGDMMFPLPDPLVDRCEVIRRFEMDPKMVAKLAF